MKNIPRYLVLLVALFFTQPVQLLKAQGSTQAFIPGDFADPSVIKANGTYYSVATSSEWAPHFPIYRSKDLKTWTQTGYVFDKAPAWTAGSFWAPEYFYNNGLYYIYYTARRKADNISCIGVATSRYPDHGFVDHGVVVSYGKEAIDGFIYKDNGQLYITFKAYGLDSRPIEILGSKLSADGLKMEGGAFSLLTDTDRQGMEGESVLKHDGFYYLFYSSGNCCGGGCSYNVRVARSKNFKGPYEVYAQNPILQAYDAWKCPGHGTFVKGNDGQYSYLYHAYSKESSVFTGRQGMVATLHWHAENGWPALVPQQTGHGKGSDIVTSFNEAKPAIYWQWDFRNTTPVVHQEKGQLQLSGTVKEGNNTGVVLTVRPVSEHFDMTTTVTNNNDALKGLACYGDANAAVGVGVIGDKVEYWMVKDNKRVVLQSEAIKPGIPVSLKLSLLPDQTCTVFYRQGNGNWLAIGTPQDVSFLPPWDRSPRPGLHFQGVPGQSAVFAEFALKNL